MPNEPALPWIDALRSRRFLVLTVSTVVFLVAALLSLNSYLQFNEQRTGVALADPVLARLPAVDLSWAIFALLYGSLITVVTSLARQPRLLLIALQAYALLAVIRIAMMYSIPLEAPPGMIMLVDPFVRVFGGGENWAKDLFFSGHTSTTFLCALSVRSRAIKLACFGACACVAAMVLLQHVHYTIDVLVAPFVAYGSLRLARHLSAFVLDR
jgi:hypothetical protein